MIGRVYFLVRTYWHTNTIYSSVTMGLYLKIQNFWVLLYITEEHGRINLHMVVISLSDYTMLRQYIWIWLFLGKQGLTQYTIHWKPPVKFDKCVVFWYPSLSRTQHLPTRVFNSWECEKGFETIMLGSKMYIKNKQTVYLIICLCCSAFLSEFNSYDQIHGLLFGSHKENERKVLYCVISL